MKRNIRLANKELVEVDALPIVLPKGFEDMELFVHKEYHPIIKDSNLLGWQVTEAESGFLIATDDTQQGSIDIAIKKIQMKGNERVKVIRQKVIAEFGEANPSP